MPGKPFQSKLEPFLEQIRQWRSQRWSYPRIAEGLHKEHGMTVAPSTIFSLVKVRAKGRKVFALPSHDSPPSTGSNAQQQPPAWPSTEIRQRAKGFFKTKSDSHHENTTRPYKLE